MEENKLCSVMHERVLPNNERYTHYQTNNSSDPLAPPFHNKALIDLCLIDELAIDKIKKIEIRDTLVDSDHRALKEAMTNITNGFKLTSKTSMAEELTKIIYSNLKSKLDKIRAQCKKIRRAISIIAVDPSNTRLLSKIQQIVERAATNNWKDPQIGTPISDDPKDYVKRSANK